MDYVPLFILAYVFVMFILYSKTVILYIHSFYIKRQNDTLYVPMILGSRVIYIPLYRRPERKFYITSEVDDEIVERSIDTVQSFELRIDEEYEIKVIERNDPDYVEKFISINSLPDGITTE